MAFHSPKYEEDHSGDPWHDTCLWLFWPQVRELWDRLRGAEPHALSARNHFRGVVQRVEVDGLLAQIEIEVTEPSSVTAIITRAAAEELGLRPGMAATGVVKATSVMVER